MKSEIHYTIGVENLAKIIKDVRVCKGVEPSTIHCFISIRLLFQTRWVNEQKLKGKETHWKKNLLFIY